MTGTIFNIQRFSTQDGPGIRTVLFLKGCPLDCAWCHNPESKRRAPEVLFSADRCIRCGLCAQVCGQGGHQVEPEGHTYLRSGCCRCMRCAESCPAGALEACGKELTPEEAVEELSRDRIFYDQSGGGITLSGGEPLAQFDFTCSVLRLAKEQGMHTAVETSGYTTRDIAELAPYVDLWLYDIKLLAEEEHLRYTGVSNRLILENLEKLDRLGAKVILRCPILPDVNMTAEHFSGIAALAQSLHRLEGVHFEPYHPLGISKAQRLDREQGYQNPEFLAKEQLWPFVEKVREQVPAEVLIL